MPGTSSAACLSAAEVRDIVGRSRDLAERQAGDGASPDALRPSWSRLLPAMSRALPLGGRPVPAAAKRFIPFADLYWPVVVLARAKVEAETPVLAARLEPAAWRALEHDLLSRLAAICSLAFQPRFLAFKAVRAGGWTASDLYGDFVDTQRAAGLRGFFLAYPVAARLAAQVSLAWIETTTELCKRLQADQRTLSGRFFAGQPLGSVTSIQAGLSDPHQGGRAVLILSFENGGRLVYKPRPLQIDAAFFVLLAWFNAHSQQPPLRTLKTLARADYGWEEFIEAAPCRDRRAARQFYRQAGALLYLLHALRGIDLHCENMLATAEGPVVIDLETLFHPPLPIPAVAQAHGKWLTDTSVLRTGMLPVRERLFRDQPGLVYAALGAPIRQRSALAEVRWKHINSDRMEAVREHAVRVCAGHRPRWRGRLLSLRAYLPELSAGFAQAAHLLRPDGPLAVPWSSRVNAMRKLPARVVKRSTLIYTALLRSSLRPQFLADGLARSMELETLPLQAADAATRRAELVALERLDVPYFRHVPSAGSPTSVPAPEAADLDWQLHAIEACIQGALTVEPGA